MTTRLEFKFPGNFEFVKMFASITEKICEMEKIPPENSVEIVSSVIEVLNNSIEHGYAKENLDNIILKIELKSDQIIISVRDFGIGFNRENYRAYCPERKEDLYKCRGRGIFLIENFMDEVIFNNKIKKGTEVIMKKNLTRE